MEHKWNRLDRYTSDHSCLPIYTTTWEQCENCRCVRHTVETPGYEDSTAFTHITYSVGDGMIDIQPTCVQQVPKDVALRQEINTLRKSLDDLMIRSYQR